MDSKTATEVALIKEADSNDKTKEDGEPISDQNATETKDDALAAGSDTGHEDKSNVDEAPDQEVHKEARDSTTADSEAKDPLANKGEEVVADNGQAEKDTEGSQQSKIDNGTLESDPQKAQSDSETEKVPLNVEAAEEEEEDTQCKVRFDVSRESTEAAEESKVDLVDPTAAVDSEQGVGTPTKPPLQSIESGRGKEPVWFSRTSLLITSIFSILCFFPMGIIALYYGIKVKDSYHSRHKASKVKEYARRSTFCSVAAITTGIVALLLILLVIILGITGVVQ